MFCLLNCCCCSTVRSRHYYFIFVKRGIFQHQNAEEQTANWNTTNGKVPGSLLFRKKNQSASPKLFGRRSGVHTDNRRDAQLAFVWSWWCHPGVATPLHDIVDHRGTGFYSSSGLWKLWGSMILANYSFVWLDRDVRTTLLFFIIVLYIIIWCYVLRTLLLLEARKR